MPSFPPESPSSRRRALDRELREWDWLVQVTVRRWLRRLPPSVALEDLLSAGRAGLWELLKRSPIRAEAFLQARIRGAVGDELRKQDWISRRARTHIKEGVTAPVFVAIDDLGDGDWEWEQSHLYAEAIGHPDRRMVEIAIGKLSEHDPRDAEIIRAHYFEDIPMNVLAARLGISEPRISQLHARALRRLRELLAPSGDGEPPADLAVKKDLPP
jgi:RNA polymerase sigma factor FliA